MVGTSKLNPVDPTISKGPQLDPVAAYCPSTKKTNGVEGNSLLYAHPTHLAESSSMDMLLVSK